MLSLFFGFLLFLCLYILTAVKFIDHNIEWVFNRDLSKMTWSVRMKMYIRFASIIRPGETLFRFVTAFCRVLPDLAIVGQVRCGTTSTAQWLKDQGAIGPFTPWVHPLAGKESFYFVGHYFGFVHPSLYSMAFPTIFWMRYQEWRYGRKPLVFDGCAQYLTSPWVANLLHEANKNLRIVICTRDPVAQNLSWWRFETAASRWANSLGVPDKWNEYRMNYPPTSFRQAIELSQSSVVCDMFSAAEKLKGPFLPKWAGTTPNGQLSGLTQQGRFIRDIKRYAKIFGRNNIFVQPLEKANSNLEPLSMFCFPQKSRNPSCGESKPQLQKLNATERHSCDPILTEEEHQTLKNFYEEDEEELRVWISQQRLTEAKLRESIY